MSLFGQHDSELHHDDAGDSRFTQPLEDDEEINLQIAQVGSDALQTLSTLALPNQDSGGIEPEGGPSSAGTEEESDEQPLTRSNKYTGPALKWRNWTADERALHQSLKQIEAGDLSMHLYNVHALKQRLRTAGKDSSVQPWRAKRHWAGSSKENAWVPPESWTAWPLEADVVPRPDEEFDAPPPDREDAFSMRREEQWRPSGELEEELLAVMLRKVKERWTLRQGNGRDDRPVAKRQRREMQPASPHERHRSRTSSMESASISRALGEEFDKDGDSPGVRDTENQSLAGEITIDSADIAKAAVSSRSSSSGSESSTAKKHVLMEDLIHNLPERSRNLETSSRESSVASLRDQASNRSTSRRPSEAEAELVLSADDDQSRLILQPTVRSVLSKLDALLDALYITRRNHYHEVSDYSDPEPATRTDAEFLSEKSGRSTHHSGRSRSRPKGSRRRRRSHSKARIRRSSGPEDSDTAKVSSKTARRNHRSGRKQLGLMDWSEVLGNAALIGFPPDAIERAVQRCSSLFNEGMDLRTFHEGAQSEVVHYVPEPIPPLDNTELSGHEIEPASDTELKPDSWAPKSLACPIKSCRFSQTVFDRKSRLLQHMKRAHDYDPTVDGAFVEREDTVGSIHVDGFLQRIQRQKGWRGKGKPKEPKSRGGSASEAEL